MSRLSWLLVTVCSVCTVIHAQDIVEISSAYHNSDNALVRKNALRQLSKKQDKTMGVRTPQTLSPTSQEAEVLIKQALNDPNPTVVEEAIVQAGQLSLTSIEQDMYRLYMNAEKRFGSYSERIICAIYKAAGDLGGAMSKKILLEELRKDRGSYRSGLLLDAFLHMEDASVITEIKEYAERMEKIAYEGKRRGDNPLLYSNALTSADKAHQVVSLLANGKAGN